MASLSSQSIASSYEQLLHVDRDGGGNGTTLVDVKDGDNGTTFALKLAQFHAEIRGTTGTGATGAGKLNLSTAELTVVDNDVLGRIDFLAPLESSGTDAILAGASIWGEAEDTFAADNNSTALVFATNTSAAATERMRLTSGGSLGIGTDSPDKLLHLKSSGSESPCIKIENNNDDQYPPRIQFVKDVGNDAEADYDQLGSIAFRGQDTNNNLGTFAHILGKSLDVTDSTEDGQLVIDVMKNNDADGVQVFIDPVGFDVYGTPLKVFGANTSHETSALCISQDTSALSQIRAYGADDSTAGTLEFRMTSSAGAVNQGVMKLDVNSRISLSNNDAGGTGGSDSLSANTFLGYLAGQDIADGGGDNTYFGHKSGNNNATGTNNTSFGSNAAKGSHGNSHSYNTAVGADALLSISTGNYNVAVGSRCGDAITDGHQNTFVGDFAGGTTTSVGFATALGHGAMGSADTTSAADYTVAVGTNALENLTSGADCLAIGGGALGANTTGNHNLAIGRNSLNNLNHANSVRNIAIGAYSGDGMGTLDGNFDNVFIGYGSGGGTWTGAASKGNIGIGTSAMDANMNTAYYNTAVGNSALSGLTSGDDNVAIGGDAGKQLTSGDDNTFVGFQAGTATGSGSSNVAVGHTALATQANASAVGNVAVGASALKDMNGAHTNNIAIGLAAIENASTATTFTNNIAIGAYAFDDSGSYDQTGTIAIGGNALTSLGAGIGSTAVGHQSGKSITTGDYNTAFGYNTLGGNTGNALTGDRNTVIGASAGRDMQGASTNNTLVGDSSGIAITTGSYNTIIGTYAGDAITTSSNCTLIGRAAGSAINHTDANGTVCVGNDSGEANQSGEQMTAIGKGALQANTIGDNNTALGYESLKSNVDGSNNVAVGGYALYTFEASSAGDGCNTAMGANVGYLVSTGQDNVLIGENAGWINGGVSLTTGSGNTLVGYQAAIGAADATNRTAIGKGATAVGDNSVTLGNADVDNIYMGQDKGAAVRADNSKIYVQGVEFPDSQSASGDANVLDDYEEGLDTVAIAAGSGTITIHSSNDQISYTKIGRVVHITGRLNVSAISSPSGDLTITGLPFAAADTTETSELGAGGVYLDNANGAIDTYAICFVAGGTTTMHLREAGGTGNGADLAAHIDTDTKINIEITYFTT